MATAEYINCQSLINLSYLYLNIECNLLNFLHQVGKAHLRSLLDSDKREVRLLQEMYLEDGELHGQGRSRQFRLVELFF